MAKKKPTIVLPAGLAEAGANAGIDTTTGTKAVMAAPVDNTMLGLKNANGKVLPNTITVQQFKDAISDKNYNIKYNAAAIESLKQTAAMFMPVNTNLSATGTISPSEVNSIVGLAKRGFANTPIGTPIDIMGTANAIKNGTLGGSDGQQSTYTRTTLDQPNIEASKATINDVFLNLLGRTATEKEIGQYTKKYLDYAAKNPANVSRETTAYKTITTPTASGGTSNRLFRDTTTGTSVGNNLTEQEYLKNQVKGSGEYNAFTAAGSAFDMMTKMAQKDTGAM
jgi:hypothetical protein